jgi:serine protease inhibitor
MRISQVLLIGSALLIPQPALAGPAQSQSPSSQIEMLVAEQKIPPQQQKTTTVTYEGNGTLLTSAQAKLAWDLIAHLSAGNNADSTISPASLANAMAILGEGADATMKAGMAKALGFEESESGRSFAALNSARADLAADTSGMFRLADRIIFAPEHPPSPNVTARMAQLGVACSIEDLSKPEAVTQIDDWVKETTNGAIPEILGGPLDDAALAVIDAVYFKGKWREPFPADKTAPARFTNVDGGRSEVAMMHLPMDSRHYRAEGKFIGVNLAFAGPKGRPFSRFALVVVTTTDKPAAAKDFAAVANWLAGAGFDEREGDLALPRFKISTPRLDLLNTLEALGLDKARRSSDALSGFGKEIALGRVVQRVLVEVNEEGAEAAAATAIEAYPTSAPSFAEPKPKLRMIVDKPFMFALRDRVTGMILAAGCRPCAVR